MSHRLTRRRRVFLGTGICLVLFGVGVHEWTLTYLLQPTIPFRISARLHWWYVSMNACASGLWLILGRNRISPAAAVAVGVLYGTLGTILVGLDLGRGYFAVRQTDSRIVTSEYLTSDEQLGWSLKPGATTRVVRQGVYDAVYSVDRNGFRNTAYRDPGVRPQIFVLGDSFAFGWGVSDHEDVLQSSDETAACSRECHQLGG